jgi:hypothetical protein
MSSYAYMCDVCHHEGSKHRRIKGASLYRCQRCDCLIPRDGPMTGISEAQYRIWLEGLAQQGGRPA